MNLVSIIVEGPVVRFDTGFSQSIRASIAYGLPWTNAQYVPVHAHYIMFRGADHLEVFGGVALQVAWHERSEEDKIAPWGREFASSNANPSFGLGYRYEKPAGGFVFRIGLSAMYVANDMVPWMPGSYVCFGHSF